MVCSDQKASVLFTPCQHMNACAGGLISFLFTLFTHSPLRCLHMNPSLSPPFSLHPPCLPLSPFTLPVSLHPPCLPSHPFCLAVIFSHPFHSFSILPSFFNSSFLSLFLNSPFLSLFLNNFSLPFLTFHLFQVVLHWWRGVSNVEKLSKKPFHSLYVVVDEVNK